MQKKEQNNSPIKQRILQFIDYLNISKREFYQNTGISRGTLDNVTGITEETLAKLFAFYKNINPSWLLTGIGSMVLDFEQKTETIQQPFILDNSNCPICIEKDKKIADQAERIEELKYTIALLRAQVNAPVAEAPAKRKTA